MNFQTAFALPAVALALAVSFPAAALAHENGSLLDMSRELRTAARTAAGARDWEAARRLNDAARALQPGHPGLLNNAVLIAGFAGRADDQFEALEQIARAGLAYDLDTIGPLEMLENADVGRLAAIRARLAGNAAAVGRAGVVAEPQLPDALVEALAYDAEAGHLYLGAVAERRIYRVDLADQERIEVFSGADDGVASIFGLAIDRENGLLYAASGTVPQTPRGADEGGGTALLSFALDGGELHRRLEIEGAVRIADVTVHDSVVYAADAEGGRIYRADGPDGDLEVFAQDARFASLQGLAVARGALWALDYALGLWRIDLADGTATLARVTDTASLIGMDGLAADASGRLFATRNGAEPMGVFEIVTGEAGVTALKAVLAGDPRFGEPTSLRIVDGTIFLVANAQWALFPEDGADPGRARANPVILSTPVPLAPVAPTRGPALRAAVRAW